MVIGFRTTLGVHPPIAISFVKILHQNRERIAADDGFNLTNYVQRCDDLTRNVTDLEVETKPLFSIGQFNYFARQREF